MGQFVNQFNIAPQSHSAYGVYLVATNLPTTSLVDEQGIEKEVGKRQATLEQKQRTRTHKHTQRVAQVLYKINPLRLGIKS